MDLAGHTAGACTQPHHTVMAQAPPTAHPCGSLEQQRCDRVYIGQQVLTWSCSVPHVRYRVALTGPEPSVGPPHVSVMSSHLSSTRQTPHSISYQHVQGACSDAAPSAQAHRNKSQLLTPTCRYDTTTGSGDGQAGAGRGGGGSRPLEEGSEGEEEGGDGEGAQRQRSAAQTGAHGWHGQERGTQHDPGGGNLSRDTAWSDAAAAALGFRTSGYVRLTSPGQLHHGCSRRARLRTTVRGCFEWTRARWGMRQLCRMRGCHAVPSRSRIHTARWPCSQVTTLVPGTVPPASPCPAGRLIASPLFAGGSTSAPFAHARAMTSNTSLQQRKQQQQLERSLLFLAQRACSLLPGVEALQIDIRNCFCVAVEH